MSGKSSNGTVGQTLFEARLIAPPGSSSAHAALPLEQFLRMALRIARALAEYHGQRGVHGHLSPAIIVPFGADGEAEIKSPAPVMPGDVRTAQERWIYLSPEQTGRLERPVDARSDLYALGVILYELLVGALPFKADDALAWIHSHVAKLPRPPASVVPTVPKPVSDIVMKLLAKEPEDRYQTAGGLQHDLESCLDQWERTGQIAIAALGARDDVDRFAIPQKIHGRDAERAALLSAFAKVLEEGKPRLFLFAGGPGVGKTALVRELAKPVVAANGIFCTGKFDQFQRDVPYAPIVRAFRDLMTLILAGSDERLALWRQRLSDAVGINGRLITDLLPEVTLVIGAQPPVAPMPPAEAHRRFVNVFRRFIHVFATAEHPLALFLDDLQWADAASLSLIGDIVEQQTSHPLLFIGAYRDGEVSAEHPLLRLLDEIRAAGTPIEELTLEALGIEPLGRIVADTLRATDRECETLTRLIFEKTRGNPFFFTRFLAMLHRSGLVRFDGQTMGWTWDTESIGAQDFSDNVVDLMARQLRHCAPETERALSLAACLGNTFDPEALVAVGERSRVQTAEALEQAVQEGLVVRTPNGCRFVHDRIQQAAYARIPEDQREATHLSIGRILLARTPKEALPDRIFDLLSQLNRGIAILDEQSEREQLARLNLIAARRARASAAFRAAADYCAAGLLLLPADAFAHAYELAFALSLECAECELATGKLEEAERRLAPAQEHARTRGDRAACWRVAIELHTARGQSMAALDASFECLRLYELNLSAHPSADEVQAAEQAMLKSLGDRAIEAIADLPLMGESDMEAAVNVLAGTLYSAYFVDPHLHRLIACTMVDLALRHGLCTLAPMGVAAYGMELAISGRYEEAERFGRAALGAVERHQFVACKAGVLQILGAGLVIWTSGLPSAIELVRESARAGMESGEGLVTSISQIHVLILSFAAGIALDEVEREADRALDVLRGAGYGAMADAVHIPKRIVQALRGGSDDASLLSGPDFDAFVQRVTAHPIPIIGTWLHVHLLPAWVVLGETARALAASAAARPGLILVRPQHAQDDHAFYSALALAAACDDGPADARPAMLDEIRAYAEQLKRWAASSPKSYFHQSSLVLAEIARIEGRLSDAMSTYDQAICAARESGAVHVEALAHERAARAYRAHGLASLAELSMREARACYRRWGAFAKVRRLDAEWPSIAPRENRAPLSLNTRVDAIAVVKASQTISSEIILERLLEKLLRVAIEQAGAQQGVLLLLRQGEFSIAATAVVQGESLVVSVCDPLQPMSGELLPTSVIYYVRRTVEPLIVADASTSDTFASDPYIFRQKTKSILAVPIVRQGELQGVLYLANDLVANAFTQGRLSVLELLVAQIAISLENATLYADLRREMAERERTEQGLRASEAQLRQAQKMEAIGQLAGGIAHDFNNLLTAICGYSALAIEQLPRETRVRKEVEEIQKAGERAAALTRQLLAFSRRQVLTPRALDLNSVVRGMEAMLRRLISAAVDLVTSCADDLGIVKADPSQVEQILMNLAVNARDAMPNGGTLTIETKNRELDEQGARELVALRPGSYVVLAVSDTGEGMSEATRARIFEPFFTTKEQGKGTGLGLSTVYGIVQQSGGHIEVDSELGRGTHFTIYLPRAEELVAPSSEAAPRVRTAGGSETILLVEDEDLVRNFARDVLSGLGYHVLTAADGFEALRVQARERRPIQLLITDVVMPHLSGPQLAKRLQPLLPDMAVLFVSGYAADAVVTQGILQSDAAFLQKPFSPHALAHKARQALDGRRRS
ncbi:MAG TPA: AAA family ATPase [Polyangiaceae bacterium]|nr:AAA family ATPase [Polyangiaceae bacterium]